MTLDIETLITVIPPLFWTALVIAVIYIVTSNDGDDDNLSTP
jgi:hypothetical protein